MLGHDAGIGYTGPNPRMGPIDNFSLVTGPFSGNLTPRMGSRVVMRHDSCVDFGAI